MTPRDVLLAEVREGRASPVEDRASGTEMDLYFSDCFGVAEDVLDSYGAFNISLVTDLPLFVDPFLLFNSQKPEYRALHDDIIRYLRFLKSKSEAGGVTEGLRTAWYRFGEVKQNWLGFCGLGNTGRGLGEQFASALDQNLVDVFRNFGAERVTRGSHLEKLCLISPGVGRDMISDFTTNLIKRYLCEYTAAFAAEHLAGTQVREVSVDRVYFSYDTERWMPRRYPLPIFRNQFVLLTPKDMLTRDDTWISHADMVGRFFDIPSAVSNEQLRAEINNYLYSRLPKDRKPTEDDHVSAINATLKKYPTLIDFYIKRKEDDGDEAIASSSRKVKESVSLYVHQFGGLISLLHQESGFYNVEGATEDEARQRLEYFRDVIENKGGYRLFYDSSGNPIRRESDVQLLFRLVWFGTPSDVSREVNDGRGPVDYKVSRGAFDKSLVEFKLASNSQLRRNLAKQVEVYKSASDAKVGFKAIIYFSDQECDKVQRTLQDLGLDNSEHVVLIDARADNKPSGSKA